MSWLEEKKRKDAEKAAKAASAPAPAEEARSTASVASTTPAGQGLLKKTPTATAASPTASSTAPSKVVVKKAATPAAAEAAEEDGGDAGEEVSGPKPLGPNLTCHSWNKDFTKIAFSANNNDVKIYKVSGDNSDTWVEEFTLKQHGGFVSGIDWCHSTNVIVTCGHDRNAYVWKYSEKTVTDEKTKKKSVVKEWIHNLVILRINRGATAVKWSPLGNKFAVTSGSKNACVPVCHYEADNDWWVSKMIKKHKSTVLAVDWCPNNKFVVTGSTDFVCRVCSAYIEGIDSAEDDGFGSVWANQHEFGEVLVEFNQAKAWVNGVSWSSGAFRLAFTGMGSTIHFVQLLADSAPIVTTVNHRGLPFIDCGFLNENVVVATGYDCNPTVFCATGADDNPKWSYVEALDKPKKVAKKAVSAAKATFNKFAAAVDQGQQFGESEGAAEAGDQLVLNTRHSNYISSLYIFPVDGNRTRFSTAGIDGRLLVWDLSQISDLTKKSIFGL